ncbi:MAG: peptidase G2 autoproteolytic cleavage domain-containing protein [Actinomyces sp.]|nr:peptidase G2 autoproteolytic cleavage domain-containing protein [Actinomyces sp.]
MKLNLLKKLDTIFNDKFIGQNEQNYEKIEKAINGQNDDIEYHRNNEKDAHNSNNVTHYTKKGQKTNVGDELRYQNEVNDHLVLGALGNGQQEVRQSRVSIDAQQHQTLEERLKHDFLREKNDREKGLKNLLDKINRVVNVDEFGADPTGVKDSTNAFVKAFGNGNVQVTMSAGTYKVYGLKLPNNTRLVGQGKDITTIKLADEAPAETVVITNLSMGGNAKNIAIENFSVDGNRKRKNNSLKAAGGSLSSNVRFAGVKHGYIYNIKSFSTLLHGIDVTYGVDEYFYGGDGARPSESLESKYVHVNNCETYDFGDDGITVHWSRYILITDCYSHDPIGGGNNNGIEVDDGSQFVFLSDNKTENNYGGLEIKAHATASAPQNIFVNNHMSIRDTRSYNIRHIGHHKASDPQSKTAFNVVLSNCSSVYPQFNGVYPNTSPRAIVVCAFRNVLINNFSALGDSKWSSGQPVAVVQYRAENVTFNGVNIQGFSTASADLKIMGGNNRPKKITFANVNLYKSSKTTGISGGSKVYDTKIIGGNLIGAGTGNAIEMYNNTAEIVNVQAEGYTNQAVIAGRNYSKVPTVVKGGFSGASTGGGALAETSALIASTGGSYAHSNRSWVAGSGMNSHAYGSRSSVLNSLESETIPGSYCQTIVNSRGVKSPGNYHFLLGYGTNGARTSNIKIDMSSTSGNIKTAGQVTTSNNFADYAEYFESQSGGAIRNGTIVTLEGRYIRKCQENDVPLGVVSGTAGIILGDQTFHHKDRYERDEFGVILTEEQLKTWTDDSGNEYSEYVEVPIERPDYEENEYYESREERPEWNVVGLIGQIYIAVDNTVEKGDWIRSRNGKGTKDNANGYYQVMEVTTPYNQEKGYGVAVCYVHPVTKGAITNA